VREILRIAHELLSNPHSPETTWLRYLLRGVWDR
jgi:hypothetical protein